MRRSAARMTLADFSRLPTRCRFIAFMPQWDFLDYVARQAARYPSFQLLMSTAVDDLIEENGRVVASGHLSIAPPWR